MSVECSQFHAPPERVARWLLTHKYRTGIESFPFSHEFLAAQVGAHPTIVKETLADFERQGIVRHGRNTVSITDQEGWSERLAAALPWQENRPRSTSGLWLTLWRRIGHDDGHDDGKVDMTLSLLKYSEGLSEVTSKDLIHNIVTREGFMMTSTVVQVSSVGTLLFLGLFTLLQMGDVAFAAKEMKRSPCDIPPGQNAMRAEENLGRGAHIISGELIGMDGDYYVVKDEEGTK